MFVLVRIKVCLLIPVPWLWKANWPGLCQTIKLTLIRLILLLRILIRTNQDYIRCVEQHATLVRLLHPVGFIFIDLFSWFWRRYQTNFHVMSTVYPKRAKKLSGDFKRLSCKESDVTLRTTCGIQSTLNSVFSHTSNTRSLETFFGNIFIQRHISIFSFTIINLLADIEPGRCCYV